MLNTIWLTLQSYLGTLFTWWNQIPLPYRAGSCVLASLFLMWQATTGEGEHDRRFFLSGIVALILLGYGAMMFIQGNAEYR